MSTRQAPQYVQMVILLAGIQLFWCLYDSVPSTERFTPPRVRLKPNATSPLSPFFTADGIPTNHGNRRGHSRVYQTRPKIPCDTYLDKPNQLTATIPAYRGILYTRITMAASATLSGVTARISRNVAARNGRSTSEYCAASIAYGRARKFLAHNRTDSFLWSFVREPAARLISKFHHFAVSRDGMPVTADAFQGYLRRVESYDLQFYLKALNVRHRSLNPYRSDNYATYVEEILEDYDFIGVSERMEESLAVMQLLLGLETQDILHLSIKKPGTYDYDSRTKKCFLIQKPNVTVEFKKVLYSSQFEDYVLGDVMIYRAAQSSLDRTIAALGRDRVNRAVHRLRFAQNIVKNQCQGNFRLPCSADGKPQESDCFYADFGCGYACLDRVGNQLSKNRRFRNLPTP